MRVGLKRSLRSYDFKKPTGTVTCIRGLVTFLTFSVFTFPYILFSPLKFFVSHRSIILLYRIRLWSILDFNQTHYVRLATIGMAHLSSLGRLTLEDMDFNKFGL